MAVENPRQTGASGTATRYFTADGTETAEVGKATRALITESRDGAEVARHYANVEAPAPQLTYPDPGTAYDDAGLHESRRWDIWVIDGWTLPQSAADLLTALGVGDKPLAEQREAVGRVRGMPYWQDGPEAMRADVDRWLVETRTAPGKGAR